MKTWYEILEVSENASKEIIEKAYRVLAKKYHPDLQTEENKQLAENKMKEINEAYSILGDEAKRKDYDSKLQAEREAAKAQEANRVRYEQNNAQANYQAEKQQAYYNTQRQNEAYNQSQRPMTEEEYQELEKRRQEEIKKRQKMERQMQAEYEQRYQEAYEGYLRSLGYRIKHRWTWKRVKELAVAILIIIAICTVLWIFPPTHKWLVDFYHSNFIIKGIVDVIRGIIIGIWNTICSIFT